MVGNREFVNDVKIINREKSVLNFFEFLTFFHVFFMFFFLFFFMFFFQISIVLQPFSMSPELNSR